MKKCFFVFFFLSHWVNVGLGSAAGYLFGAVKLDEIAMYGVGLCIFIPCSIISLLAAKERRYVPTLTEKLYKASHPKGIKNVILTLKGFPFLFYFLMFSQLIAWSVENSQSFIIIQTYPKHFFEFRMGLWPVWTFVSDWMGETIFGVGGFLFPTHFF